MNKTGGPVPLSGYRRHLLQSKMRCKTPFLGCFLGLSRPAGKWLLPWWRSWAQQNGPKQHHQNDLFGVLPLLVYILYIVSIVSIELNSATLSVLESHTHARSAWTKPDYVAIPPFDQEAFHSNSEPKQLFLLPALLKILKSHIHGWTLRF